MMTPITPLLSLASLLASSRLCSGTTVTAGSLYGGLGGKVLSPTSIGQTVQGSTMGSCAALAAREKSHFAFTSAKECQLAGDTFDPVADVLPDGNQKNVVYVLRPAVQGLTGNDPSGDDPSVDDPSAPETTTPAPVQPPWEEKTTPCLLVGLSYGHKDSCNKYYQCQLFLVITEETCPTGLHFDVFWMICKPPADLTVPCPYA